MSEPRVSEVPTPAPVASEPAPLEQQVTKAMSALSTSQEPCASASSSGQPFPEEATVEQTQSKNVTSGELTSDQATKEQLDRLREEEKSKQVVICTEFKKFPKLAAELRLKIWSFTENFDIAPRWFSVAPWIDNDRNKIPPLTIIEKGEGCGKRQQVPFNTMAICGEARKEALRSHVRRNSMAYFPGDFTPNDPSEYNLNCSVEDLVYVNPAKDIFYVDADWPTTKFEGYAIFPRGSSNTASEVPPTAEECENYNTPGRYGYRKTPPKIFDVSEIVFTKVEHLAVGFAMLHESSKKSVEFFLTNLTNYGGLKDLTIVLPEGAPRNFYSFRALGHLCELQNETFRKISGLLKRYVTRLFDEHFGSDPDGKQKRPNIKVVFHKVKKSDFLGHTDSYHQGIPYTEDGEFDTREEWEKEWSDKVYAGWSDVLQEFEDFEASLPGPGFVPSWMRRNAILGSQS